MTPIQLSAAVEGPVDAAVVRRLVEHVGAELTAVYGLKGKPFLRQRLPGFNHAARRFPWIVLVDLDSDYDCAPLLVQEWLPDPAPNMCLRVAVREVEAWLLADREQIAAFLGVSASLVPMAPESLADPKQTLIGLARRSRKRAIRTDMVPRPEAHRTVGPGYVSRMVEFVQDYWRVDAASKTAPSLARSLRRLGDLLGLSAGE